jgi:hypothetical protein
MKVLAYITTRKIFIPAAWPEAFLQNPENLNLVQD